MTYSSCLVTLTGLKSIKDPANPKPFRKPLPPTTPGHYWASAVAGFAKRRGIRIDWISGGDTPEITVAGPVLLEILLDAYGNDDPFLKEAAPFLSPAFRYRVYADDY